MFLEELFSLEGRVALVTGARRGIGRELAFGLARAGANIAVTDIAFQELEATARDIEAAGRPVLALEHDVTRPESSREVLQKTVDRFGRVDIVVNNAGVCIVEQASEMSEDSWDSVIDVNLKGTFLVSQAAARHMIRQGKGKIINIASALGFVGMGQRASYTASKGGVVLLTKELACEWAQYGINVNAIAPGSIRTELSAKLHQDKAYLSRLLDRLVIKRIGEPKDLLGALIFLASSSSDLVTGHTLLVDQGWTIQ